MPAQSSRTAPERERARFKRNVLSNVAFVVFNTMIMLLYVPYLIKSLGVEGYSVVPLVLAIVSYATIVTDSVNLATYRFVSFELHQGNVDRARRTFHTALSCSLILLAVALPICAAMSLVIPKMFRVPSQYELDAAWLFASAGFSMFLGVVSSTFGVSTLILERFDLKNAILATSLCVRVGWVLIAFNSFVPRPSHVAEGLFASSVVVLLASTLIWRQLTPELRSGWFTLDRASIRELGNLIGWAVVVRVGILIFNTTDLIIVNLVFGAAATGRYAALLLFAEMARVLAQTVASVLSPAIMVRYAKGQREALGDFVLRSVRLLGYTLAAPVGLAVGLATPLAATWLGPGFAEQGGLLGVIVAPVLVSSSVLPLAYVLDSFNQMRAQGLTTLLLGFINLSVAAFVATSTSLGPIGVAATTLVVLSANNLVLAAFASRLLGRSPFDAYLSIARSALLAAGFAILAWALSCAVDLHGWVPLITTSVLLSLIYGLFLWATISASDRRFLLDLLRRPRQMSEP